MLTEITSVSTGQVTTYTYNDIGNVVTRKKSLLWPCLATENL
ncbi:MAG: hypothetical protein KAS23_09920, partial [Anaerohalosphaera sp.]|nr:hypothetical protein [Anaerohalosphaera sp.]